MMGPLHFKKKKIGFLQGTLLKANLLYTLQSMMCVWHAIEL